MTPDDKPKEWCEWRINTASAEDEIYPINSHAEIGEFHVIEHAALTEAEAEIAELKKENDELMQYNDAAVLAKENAELKVRDFDREELLNAYKHNDKTNGPLISRLIQERDDLAKQNADLAGLASKNTLILEEQAKEIEKLKLMINAGHPFSMHAHISANEIIAMLESALGFYGETDNWPYASKGKCPGEKANEALAKLNEWRGK